MYRISLVLACFCFLSLTATSQAGTQTQFPYYGEEFYKELPHLNDESLTAALKIILKSNHARSPNGFDQVGPACQSHDCYSHVSIGYTKAKEFLLGDFYLVSHDGEFAVRDVYCEKEYGPESFRGASPGPHQIPDNTVVNVEHTWPQSRFTRKYPTDMQKSDLHHLFPSDSEINSIRGNYPFGEVAQDKKDLKCPVSRFGATAEGRRVAFEPPEAHRGNVARALFYFSVRYDMAIDSAQEKALRKWHQEDPADVEEQARNDEIYKLQGNRNPFIDHPELVQKISDF